MCRHRYGLVDFGPTWPESDHAGRKHGELAAKSVRNPHAEFVEPGQIGPNSAEVDQMRTNSTEIAPTSAEYGRMGEQFTDAGPIGPGAGQPRGKCVLAQHGQIWGDVNHLPPKPTIDATGRDECYSDASVARPFGHTMRQRWTGALLPACLVQCGPKLARRASSAACALESGVANHAKPMSNLNLTRSPKSTNCWADLRSTAAQHSGRGDTFASPGAFGINFSCRFQSTSCMLRG